MTSIDENNLAVSVKEIVNSVKVFDIHTHLYPDSFKDLFLYGFDELVTYHYLIAEALRVKAIPYNDFFTLSKKEKADFIYETLFVERTPISESCIGVLTTLNELGLDVNCSELDLFRENANSYSRKEYIDLIFEKANIKKVVMTNDPFDDVEYSFWKNNVELDERFQSSLRLDYLLNDFRSARYLLIKMGYNVTTSLIGLTKNEIKRFLVDWIKKTRSIYMAVSLPPDFTLPENSTRSILIEDCILEVSYELNVPFAMMIGVKRQTNPELSIAGDSLGKANIETIEYLCKKYNRNKFMVTMLSRENQHELTVLARKYRNLFIFGCWWFLNNPTLIKEITTIRVELLGLSFMPQHSDARVLDQLIYKWKHSRQIISEVLIDKYSKMLSLGWKLTYEKIEEDVSRLFGKNFDDFLLMEL